MLWEVPQPLKASVSSSVNKKQVRTQRALKPQWFLINLFPSMFLSGPVSSPSSSYVYTPVSSTWMSSVLLFNLLKAWLLTHHHLVFCFRDWHHHQGSHLDCRARSHHRASFLPTHPLNCQLFPVTLPLARFSNRFLPLSAPPSPGHPDSTSGRPALVPALWLPSPICAPYLLPPHCPLNGLINKQLTMWFLCLSFRSISFAFVCVCVWPSHSFYQHSLCSVQQGRPPCTTMSMYEPWLDGAYSLQKNSYHQTMEIKTQSYMWWGLPSKCTVLCLKIAGLRKSLDIAPHSSSLVLPLTAQQNWAICYHLCNLHCFFLLFFCFCHSYCLEFSSSLFTWIAPIYLTKCPILQQNVTSSRTCSVPSLASFSAFWDGQ